MSALAWARYCEFPVDSFFHLVTAWNSDGSVLTACLGRWSVKAKSEVNASPPHDLRCEGCQRHAIEVKRVEQGLAEPSAFEGEGG